MIKPNTIYMGANLKVDVYDQTDPDYTVAHELLHFFIDARQDTTSSI